MPKLRLQYLTLAPVFALVACAHLGNGVERAMRDDEPDVLLITSDTELRAAAALARERIDDFLIALHDPAPNQERFAIKVPVADGARIEHMWLTDVRADGNLLVGRLDNTPYLSPNLKTGDRLAVRPRGISDWMYIDNGRVVGAFTTRVLYARESAEAQQRIREATGLDFGKI